MVSSIWLIGGFIAGFDVEDESTLRVFLETIGNVGSSKKLSTSLVFLCNDVFCFDFYTDFTGGFAGDANRSSRRSKSSFFLELTAIDVGFVSDFLLSFLNTKIHTSCQLT